jgi:uncharacterized protein YjlB
MAHTKTAHDTVETYLFAPGGDIPNNPELPLLVYRGVLPLDGDAPSACEKLFDSNDWPSAWRNGVYPYHHFHSTAHEVLGVVRGSAKVKFGGETGQVVAVSAGDVVVITAGVGHKNEGASPDLMIIGAYPDGQDPDMNRPKGSAITDTAANVRAVPTPTSDPVFGREGPLVQEWRGSSAARKKPA